MFFFFNSFIALFCVHHEKFFFKLLAIRLTSFVVAIWLIFELYMTQSTSELARLDSWLARLIIFISQVQTLPSLLKSIGFWDWILILICHNVWFLTWKFFDSACSWIWVIVCLPKNCYSYLLLTIYTDFNVSLFIVSQRTNIQQFLMKIKDG